MVVGPDTADAIRHGSLLAQVIWRHAPRARLLNARIFDDKPVATPRLVAEGFDWLVRRGAAMINMSFGLREDRVLVREICQRAMGEGIILVAASPARGTQIYPSAYDGVISVSGDARCAADEISHLATSQAEYGACPRGMKEVGDRRVGGSSFATAHVTGKLAAYLDDGGASILAADFLRSRARYHGPERRAI